MAIEIEHKYLVKNDSFKSLADSAVDIRQGYLNRDPARTVRVRTKGDRGFITVKGSTSDDTRVEYEYPVPYGDAIAMLRLCDGTVIEKRRYLVPYHGRTWEIDEFTGSLQGLVVAEIELESSGENYDIPPFVGREVTGDPRYYNSCLDASILCDTFH